MKNKSSTAYLLYILSMLIYGSIGIFRRYIPFSSGLLACSRGFLGALFLFLLVRLRRRKLCHGIGRKKVALLALSGAIMGFNWICLFQAYNYTTVACATLYYYMEPTIVMLVSPLLFKEKLTARKWVCVVVSLIGMVLVSGVAEGGLQSAGGMGLVFGMSAAVLYSCVVILNKKVVIEDPYEKTIIQLLAAAVALVPYLLATEDFSSLSLTSTAIVMLVIVGIVHTGIAYALYFGSMQALPAQSVAVLGYIDPVSALILSGLILHEGLTVPGLVGAVLIIGAALLSEAKWKSKSSGPTTSL